MTDLKATEDFVIAVTTREEFKEAEEKVQAATKQVQQVKEQEECKLKDLKQQQAQAREVAEAKQAEIEKASKTLKEKKGKMRQRWDRLKGKASLWKKKFLRKIGAGGGAMAQITAELQSKFGEKSIVPPDLQRVLDKGVAEYDTVVAQLDVGGDARVAQLQLDLTRILGALTTHERTIGEQIQNIALLEKAMDELMTLLQETEADLDD
eukprot:CAMPEP_0175910584 /NCGR_PEP_ID=MMETSP0108-20121206/7748_1 /TAXON_ID=195067 ORGANISM="Goniomonas pacifica, Strain CCMP1869" /NCGR_SAMPLE_ID=MMETSP0108 /ASSEMBLY_ACC=CAM_ASM_000204 /LENGTH=207 /DNA_ID=CAMNT_0017232793 /DNA_START=107 /DNA_END=730 /DNA_ORIENTATION=+